MKRIGGRPMSVSRALGREGLTAGSDLRLLVLYLEMISELGCDGKIANCCKQAAGRK